MNNKIIKIGLDYHGVITDRPNFFKEFAELAVAQGIEIHIITGYPISKVKTSLSEYSIPYTTIFSIFDYYKQRGLVHYLPDGDFKIDDDLWNHSKSVYCRDQGIDLHIDDGKKFVSSFTTPFCLYNKETQSCSYNLSQMVELKKPEAALKQIIKFINQDLCRHNL